jgi:four helix bundle protein
MKIKCFEEINGWIEARELTKRIYKTISTNNFSKDFSLSDQLRRASVSIMANTWPVK